MIYVLDYVDAIFATICNSIKAKTLKNAQEELKTMTPPPMNTMLQKQPKSEALRKREDRRQMLVENVPPSTPGKLSTSLEDFFNMNQRNFVSTMFG